ncbi:RNA-binding protein [Caballeronia choica]
MAGAEALIDVPFDAEVSRVALSNDLMAMIWRTMMADLWMGNVEPGTTDEEIKEFLIKYGFPPFDAIEHIEGDGSRPAVLLTFAGVGPEALRHLQPRVHDMFWKNHKINVQVMKDRSE